jgi:DNA-binding transcriptional LysR family regulator
VELQQIRYFLSIQEHGSFSRAARECQVSQPALTASIKKLEGEIGSPLFYREGKRLVLTQLGRLVQPALEQAVGGTRSAQDIAQKFKLLRQVPLRVGVMSTIGPMRLARFLECFHRKHPGVELTVHDAALPLLQHKLENGELDLAVVSSPQPLDEGLRAEALYQEPYVVVFAPGHHLDRLPEVRLPDLNGEAYVDRLACELRETVMAVCGQRRIELYAAFRSEREDWIESMVMAGLGFAFMPRFSVRLPGLQQRPLVDPAVVRTVVVADVRGRQRSPAAKLFVDDLRAFAWAA